MMEPTLERIETANAYPKWATDFIAEAEAGFNAHDADRAAAGYAANATVEFIVDGTIDTIEGKADIHTAWKGIFEVIPNFRLSKQIVSVQEKVIVNEWQGSIRKHERDVARGIEIWRFNSNGKVIHHRLYTFLSIRPSSSLKAKLFFGLRYPGIGFGIERRRKRINGK